jgi:hypothetical protein
MYASTGLTVNGGLVVTGASTINNGLTISSLRLSGQVVITGGMTNFNNFISGSLSVNNGLVQSNAINYVTSGSLYITGQLSVSGMAIFGENYYISSGGIITKYPVSLTSGFYSDQLTTLYGSMSIAGGLTVNSAAVLIACQTCVFSGLIVYSGMICTGGVSVMDSGLYSDSTASPNLRILSSGAYIIGDSVSNNMLSSQVLYLSMEIS